MKKILLFILLISTFSFFFTACGEDDIYKDPESLGEMVDSGEAPKEDDEATKKAKKAIYEAYKTSVATIGSDAKYSLADIDENGTPELIYTVASGKYEMYTFDGKELIKSGKFNSKYGMFFYDGMLFATTGAADQFLHIKISLDENYKIYDIGYPYITKKGNSYEFNQEAISEDEYNTILSKMTELEAYPASDLSHLESILK